MKCYLCGTNNVLWTVQEAVPALSKALAGGQHFGKPLPSDGVIDGRSVVDFQHLPRSKQYAAAQEIGSTRAVILDTLTQLLSVNTFF